MLYYSLNVSSVGRLGPAGTLVVEQCLVYMLCHSIIMQTSTSVPVVPVLTKGHVPTKRMDMFVFANLDTAEGTVKVVSTLYRLGKLALFAANSFTDLF